MAKRTDQPAMGPPERYYQHPRPELVALITPGDNVVLDVGCGAGAISSEIRNQQRAREVWGLEQVPQMAELARQNGAFDRVICGDVEQLVDQLPERYFSHIVAGDVLEHLVDPWNTLTRLRQKMQPGGVFISSFPNIRTLRFVFQLLTTGSFRYTDDGVLDRTHLRFFAGKDIDALFRNAGFEGVRISEVPKRRSAVKRLARRLLGELVMQRLLVRATNPG